MSKKLSYHSLRNADQLMNRELIKIHVQYGSVSSADIRALSDEIDEVIRELGKVPAGISLPLKRSAAKVAKVSKGYAPKRTGALRKGIVVKGKRERSRTKGKYVYDVWMNPKMNETFVKSSVVGNRAYYPASMEHGFVTRSGTYYDGFHYMKTAANAVDGIYEAMLLTELNKKRITPAHA